MKYLKLYALFLIFLVQSNLFSQGIFKSTNNAFIQVENDSASIEDKDKLLNAFNFDTNAKSIDYSFLQPISKYVWLGSNIEGKSNSTITNIFANGNFVPSYKLGLSLIGNIPLGSTPKISVKKAENLHTTAIDKLDSIYKIMFDTLKFTSFKAKLDSLQKLNEKSPKISRLTLKKTEIDSIIANFKELEKIVLNNTLTYNGIRIGINSNFEGRGFYNYIRDSTFKDELVERRKNIINYNAFINYYTLNLFKAGPYIGGFSVGYSNTDNFSRLAEVSVTNAWKSEDGQGTSRSTSQKLTAFEGNYVDTIRQLKFGVDQYFVPEFLNRKIGISFNYTYNHFPNKAIKDHQDITVGVYLIKDSPFAPLQGFIFSFRDIGKQLEIPENQTRFSIGYTRQLNMYRVLKSSTSDDPKK